MERVWDRSYQYNGKEKIDELGLAWNDYGARNYDALLGRWMGVDALSEMYAPVTGYGYVLNNPISLIDPTGMKVENWYENEKGERVHKTGAEEDAYKNNTNWKDRGSDFEDKGKYYGSDGTVTKEYANIEVKATRLCKDCVNPSTIRKNIGGLTYPGGENPRNMRGKYVYSFIPDDLSEYPAIGHDRRYDKLEIEGANGLFFDNRAIGADWQFVGEELAIASIPFIGSKTRVRALGLGVGLGFCASFKTICQGLKIALISPNYALETVEWYNISNKGVTNKPDIHKH